MDARFLPGLTGFSGLLVAGAGLGLGAGALGVAAAGPASAATTLNTYTHNVAATGTFTTKAKCDTSRTTSMSTLKTYKATGISAGECHPIKSVEKDASGKNVAYVGYTYDTKYQRLRPVYSKDVLLAKAPTPNNAKLGMHSFAVYGAYATQQSAIAGQNNVLAYLKANSSRVVTWKSPVKYDATSKKWKFEVDYNSRTPHYNGHTEISTKPNVTAVTKGTDAVVVTPTKPTTGTPPVLPGTATPGNTNPTVPTTPVVPSVPEKTTVLGIDVSGWTTVQDWVGWKDADKQFLIAKASEGNYGGNKNFAQQYGPATDKMMVRGAYHFANPSVSSGVDQALFFLSKGGGWTNDGKTLPGALDIEWNPYSGNQCYDMTKEQLNQWITDFAETYKSKTGVYPQIYTARSWFNSCLGSGYDYSKYDLWMASYAKTMSAAPDAWLKYGGKVSIWQTNPVDAKGYDENIFLGTPTQLKTWASTGNSPLSK